jgi:Holliday junction resolvase
MRWASRLDRTHTEIVSVFKQLGCSVLNLSRVGQGCPDLLVARNGVAALCEVKDGKARNRDKQLRKGQVDFVDQWKGVRPLSWPPLCVQDKG